MVFRFEAFDPATVKDPEPKKLKPGIATFKIIDASDTNPDGSPKLSKASGNPQMEVVFEITDSVGTKRKMWDYFPAHLQWKIKNLLAAIDRTHACKSGMIAPSSLVNLYGQCILKDANDPERPGKMKIGPYIERAQSESVNAPHYEESLDDIPF